MSEPKKYICTTCGESVEEGQEHCQKPTPPADELERLIEECGNGITKGSGFNLSAIRLLAERVRGLENKLSVKLLDNTLARVADLTGRLEKLEETYFMEHNISNRVDTPEQTNPLTREEISFLKLDLNEDNAYEMAIKRKLTSYLEGK